MSTFILGVIIGAFGGAFVVVLGLSLCVACADAWDARRR